MSKNLLNNVDVSLAVKHAKLHEHEKLLKKLDRLLV